MKLKCIAIDDEPIALRIIEQFCLRLGDIELQVYSDATDALDKIKSFNPDIVFLDIEMTDVSGLQIAASLPRETCVVFTTAFLQYAVEGFNLDAVDYLHKPFSFERFKEAIDRAHRRIRYNQKQSENLTVLIKQEYSNVPIRIRDISYIEALENYSKLHLKSGKVILAHNSLKNMMQILPLDEFIRIHKSYIVPKSGIKSFTRQSVVLIEGERIPIGRQFINSLLSNFS